MKRYRTIFFAISLAALASCGLVDDGNDDDESSNDNDNEAPVIDAKQIFNVSESAAAGKLVGTVTAIDPDDPVRLRSIRLTTGDFANGTGTTTVRGVYTGDDDDTYITWFIKSNDRGGRIKVTEFRNGPPGIRNWKITSGNSDRVFTINSRTGKLKIADPTMLDADIRPRYRLGVTVSDGRLTSRKTLVDVNITKVPQGPVGFETDRVTNRGVEHVIHVSVDGLHPSAITTLGASKLPGFYRMRQNGSYTDNARTDADRTYTLPNHMSQLTGRPVFGARGHYWWFPVDLFEFEVSMHDLKGSYVSSVFDVVHDFGLKTAMYSSKEKFILFPHGWGEENGAVDQVWPDSGRNKINRYFFDSDTEKLVDVLTTELAAEKYAYTFLHLKDPDSAGHDFTWSLAPGSEYLEAVERVDALLVELLDFIDGNADFTGSTVLIVTSDHGGNFDTTGHAISRQTGQLESGVVPFYVYGGPVPAAEDLYTWDPASTTDPGDTHPFNDDPMQPIRNGDAANLALEFLGLPNVTESTIDNLNFPYY